MTQSEQMALAAPIFWVVVICSWLLTIFVIKLVIEWGVYSALQRHHDRTARERSNQNERVVALLQQVVYQLELLNWHQQSSQVPQKIAPASQNYPVPRQP